MRWRMGTRELDGQRPQIYEIFGTLDSELGQLGAEAKNDAYVRLDARRRRFILVLALRDR